MWDEPDSVVAEVKVGGAHTHHKKANIMKVSESDFENDHHNNANTTGSSTVDQQRKLTRQSDMRNSNRGILSSNDTQ